jgi:hypothetical protein
MQVTAGLPVKSTENSKDARCGVSVCKTLEELKSHYGLRRVCLCTHGKRKELLQGRWINLCKILEILYAKTFQIEKAEDFAPVACLYISR